RCDPGEAALAEELEGHPGTFVVRDNGGVARGEDGLDHQGKDDLVADVLDFVDERGQDPSAQDTGHIPRDLGEANLDWVIGVHEKSCLGCQRRYGLPDHASDEENYQMDRKLAEHGEEVKGEDRIFGDGEVVEEAGGEDQGADGDRGSYKSRRVGCLSKIG